MIIARCSGVGQSEEPVLTPEIVSGIVLMLMRIDERIERIERFLTEEEDGEEEADS